MPLDHFVSQVHLKQFYSPILGKRLHAIKKTDLERFIPKSEDICRRHDGNTNNYFEQPRIIEEYLRLIEPRYNYALNCIRSDNITREAIFVISGFLSYVISCSPTAMRIQAHPLRKTVELTGRLLERNGRLPSLPDGQSFSDALESGRISISIDEKYPQSIGIAIIQGLTDSFGNFPWEILVNDGTSGAFFSSDFPVVIEDSEDARISNKLMPLAPDIALRIRPRPTPRRDRNKAPNFLFPTFRYRRRNVSPAEVRQINQSIVRAAETVVFYRDDAKWVEKFVARNRNYRTEMELDVIPSGRNGFYQVFSPRIKPFRFG